MVPWADTGHVWYGLPRFAGLFDYPPLRYAVASVASPHRT